jgi:hypothetical protein
MRLCHFIRFFQRKPSGINRLATWFVPQCSFLLHSAVRCGAALTAIINRRSQLVEAFALRFWQSDFRRTIALPNGRISSVSKIAKRSANKTLNRVEIRLISPHMCC